MSETLFISDLHLDDSRPEVTELFLQFLKARAVKAHALFILGDFFEAWIGDDTADENDPIIQGIKQLTAGGLPVYFMRGNRDFLVGNRFAKLTGMKLLTDGHIIDLDGEKVLLMHGDTLCTDDKKYQQFRKMVRNPIWQWCFLHLPKSYRLKKADKARARSKAYQQQIKPEIMDVNQATVESTMLRAGVTTLIHGHTHRPNIHHIELEGQAAERIVLGDWYDQGSVLSYKNGEFTLEALPLARNIKGGN